MLAKAPTTTTYLQDEAAKEFVIQHNEEEDDDDAAIRRYREKRLEELKRSNQRPPHDRVFGQVIDITIDEYPSTIDNENALVSVAVHLYDEVSYGNLLAWIHTLTLGFIVHSRLQDTG